MSRRFDFDDKLMLSFIGFCVLLIVVIFGFAIRQATIDSEQRKEDKAACEYRGGVWSVVGKNTTYIPQKVGNVTIMTPITTDIWNCLEPQ